MNYFRIPATLLLTGAVAVACSKQDDVAVSAANPLLAYVPDDTPYVLANLEAVPAATVDAYLLRMEPFLAQAQSHMDEFQHDMDSGHEKMDQSFEKVARAVLAELDGKLNREGLESLGISLESLSAIYGNGLFPVARLGLKDAQALREAIARIEVAAEIDIPEHQTGGATYWKIENSDDKVTAYIAIIDQHVAFSAAPSVAEAEFLPGFLGQKLPETSIATTGRLSRLNQDKGFVPYGSGYLDLARALEELLDPSSTTASYLAAMGDYHPQDIDPVCATEARLIASYVPRMVGGATELTPNSVAVRYQLEMNKTLAAELSGLVADVPPASNSADYVLAAALGIKVGAVREFLLEKANAMAIKPFQCEQLAELNLQVQQLANSMNQPMPPFIGNLKGFRAVLESFDPANFEPENARGMLSLEVENPQMVIGMASMMIPGFEELNIEPGADPVLIPEELMSMVTPELEVYAVMTSNAIGMSMGKDQRQGLLPFMEQEGGNDDVFLSLDYDMAAVAELKGKQARSRSNHASYSAEETLDAHADLVEAYKNMMGRSRAEFSFTDEGLVIDSRMTFK